MSPRAPKRCSRLECDRFAPCPEHVPESTRNRPSRQARGYDAEFDAAKKTDAYISATHCATCGKPFTANNPKTAGHVNAIRDYGPNNAGVKPQCRTCNMGWRRTGS